MTEPAKKLSHRGESLLESLDVDLGESTLEEAEQAVTEATADLETGEQLERHQVDALVVLRAKVGQEKFEEVADEITDAVKDDRSEEVPDLIAQVLTDEGKVDEDQPVSTEVSMWEGGNSQLLSPKLRMIANGDDEVNAYRALFASSVSSEEPKPVVDVEQAALPSDPAEAYGEAPAGEDGPMPGAGLESANQYGGGTLRSADAGPPTAPQAQPATDDDGDDGSVATEEEIDREERGAKPASRAKVSCFVHILGDPSKPKASRSKNKAAVSGTPDGTIQIHQLTIQEIEAIRHGSKNVIVDGQPLGDVAYVETGSPLAPPKPGMGELAAEPSLSRNVERPATGSGAASHSPQVIVGIIDVGGFDFAHSDFLRVSDTGPDGFPTTPLGQESTKFLALWDQGLTNKPDATPWNDTLEVMRCGADEDDLATIEGIGPYYKEELNKRGIHSAAGLFMMAPSDREAMVAQMERQQMDEWMKDLRKRPEKVPEKVKVPFGAVYSHSDLDEALRNGRDHGLQPLDFVTQTVQQPGSHATHVASIAAGNRGACPDAWIVGVSIAMGTDDDDRQASFYDSTRLGQAIDFITSVADAAGLPVAINISLGTNGHAHDGTSPINKWIESTLRERGRVICVAAGNSGKETASFEGDLGYMSGRIHASGRVRAKDLVMELGWQVVGNGISDVSENEMEIWYNPGDEFSVQIQTPSGQETDWIKPGVYLENWRCKENTFVSIYSERFLPANGANRISLFLSPKYKGQIVGIEPGVWTVRIRGERVRDGRFNAWIERDDPRPVRRIGDSEAWSCPSFFTLESNVDASSINSLGCSPTVIAVSNVEGRGNKIHKTSSQGPTRDGRQKPDIAAPGTDIPAARGFANSPNQWITMTGTSMASPRVTGVAAAMLIKKPMLTAGQILGIMRSTARPLPGSDYSWRDDAGFGVLDERACLEDVSAVARQVESKPTESTGGSSS